MEGVPLDAVVREYSLQRQLATTIYRACGLCSKEAAGKRNSSVKEVAYRRGGTCTPWLLCAALGCSRSNPPLRQLAPTRAGAAQGHPTQNPGT